MNTCENCKFFGKEEELDYMDDNYDDQIQTGYHTCNYVEHFLHSRSEECKKPVICIDSGDYFASVLVRKDFGCIEFKPK